MKVAVLQLSAQDQVPENLAQAEAWVKAASRAGAELVLLPEGFAYLGPEEGKAEIAESWQSKGPIMSALADWARQFGIHLIAGGMAERADEGGPPYNSSAVIDPNGELAAAYRKMHLFDVDLEDGTRLTESRATTRGMTPVVCRIGEACVGLSICYDLRFPELYAWQRAHGAHILTIPAAFTQTTGAAHWHVLLRARAIETQCYVLAAAQVGRHPRGRRTFGHALIVDPWGEIVAEVTEPTSGMALFDLDLAQVERVRASMPLKAHRHAFFGK